MIVIKAWIKDNSDHFCLNGELCPVKAFMPEGAPGICMVKTTAAHRSLTDNCCQFYDWEVYIIVAGVIIDIECHHEAFSAFWLIIINNGLFLHFLL